VAPRRIIIRTDDIGSDKPGAGWDSPAEPNPALGMRVTTKWVGIGEHGTILHPKDSVAN
jgi:phosphoenolpyruvate-protein kinase (PTS system EI component)